MKTKIILPFVLTIVLLSFSAYAAISCEITDAAACAGTKVLTLSDLGDGGSHASTKDYPFYTKAVCCSGVAGLESTKADNGANYKLEMISITEGHGAKTKLSGYTQINLTSPTELTCQYMDTPTVCPGFETCLFSISGDSDAHVSTCDAAQGYVYPNKYCCRTGEATCTITGLYWGVLNEETGGLDELTSYDPGLCSDGSCVGPVGNGMDVFLIAETSGCEGTQADFTIYNDIDDTEAIPVIKNVDMGTFNGEPLPGYENVVITLFNADSHSSEGEYQWDYYFKIVLHKTGLSLPSEKSKVMKAYDGCMAEDPRPICPSLTADEIAACAAQCGGGPSVCPDTDCDSVANCIDKYEGTVADPDLVDKCSGITAGTSGCIASMDCTNLFWSECKNCEAGQECDTVGEFDAGTMFMERQKDPITETYNCDWLPPYTLLEPPAGCTNAVLDQSENRFKECIEEQEFPVFDGFNVVAVLLILSMYYAVIIIRKKK
jgi:hypothetical protein